MMKAGNIHLIQSMKGLWVKVLLLCLGLFAFEMLFAVVSTSAHVQAEMLEDMKNIPPMVQKMLGSGFADAMIKYGVIAFGYLHPFMMVLFILFAFITTGQLLTSEISSGTIGFTLAKAVSRKRLYLNMGIIIFGGFILLALSAFAASALGVVLFHGDRMPVGPFFALAWNLYLVMLLISGYVIIFASFTETAKGLYTSAGITLLVLFIHSMAAPLWSPLEYISPINPFSYYKPIDVLMGLRFGLGKSIMMIGASAAMFTAGAWIFSRRDISSG